jgi:hypothetical protein
MRFPPASRRKRETIVVVCLTLLFGGGIFLYSLMASGPWLVALLAIVAGAAVVGLLHYLVWGRRMEETTGADPHP